MQRGAPRGLSFSLPPTLPPCFLSPASPCEAHEKVRSAEACYRWTYVSIDGSIEREIFTSPYPILPSLLAPPRAPLGPSLSFSAPLVAIEITRGVGGRGRGHGGHREIAEGPRCLSRDGFTRSLSFVSLFMKSRGCGGERTGRTEIESPRDPCRPCGIN